MSDIKRNATAVWSGGLKGGQGHLSSDSGVLSLTPYNFGSRFASEPATNPEELLAAAYGGCFTMKFSAILEENQTTPERLETTATCIFTFTGGARISGFHLVIRGVVPGLSEERFVELAQLAKETCPVAGIFGDNLEFTLEASLA